MSRTKSNKSSDINIPDIQSTQTSNNKSFFVKHMNLAQATDCFNKFSLTCNKEFIDPPQVQAADALNTVFKDSNQSITLIFNGIVNSLAWTLIGEFTTDDLIFIQSL